MINYRNNNNRRNKFRTSNRNFRTNGSNIPSLGLKNNFKVVDKLMDYNKKVRCIIGTRLK